MEREAGKWYAGDYCQLEPGECAHDLWAMVLYYTDKEFVAVAKLDGTYSDVPVSQLYHVESMQFINAIKLWFLEAVNNSQSVVDDWRAEDKAERRGY